MNDLDLRKRVTVLHWFNEIIIIWRIFLLTLRE